MKEFFLDYTSFYDTICNFDEFNVYSVYTRLNIHLKDLVLKREIFKNPEMTCLVFVNTVFLKSHVKALLCFPFMHSEAEKSDPFINIYKIHGIQIMKRKSKIQ